MAPLNVGLMGYGFSTKSFHLPFIVPNPDLNVYAFLQRAEKPSDTKEKGKHCAIDYPEAKHYRTPDEFFADSKIDLVVVCTHHDTHAEFAERALNAGKHVVVEKPFTVSIPEADRVIALAKEKGKILTVFQNRRYDSDFLTLQHLVTSSAFGQITEAELHYDVDFPSWISGWTSPDYAPGQGMLYGLGSHTIDQALQLFGKPKSVTGFLRSLRGVESKTDDTFTVILQYGKESPYGKDLLVTVKTTVVSTMQYPLKFLVRGYKGSFIKYGDDPQESQVAASLSATDSSFGVEKDAVHGLLTTSEQFDKCQTKDEGSGRWVGKYPSLKGDYVGFYTDLVAAIHGKGDLKIKAEQSRDGIKIIELARESAEKGVTLPFES